MSSGEGSIADVLAGRAAWALAEGDCRDVLPTLPDKSVAHVVTDPPYSERVHARLGKEGRNDGFSKREALGFAHLEDPVGLVGEVARVGSRWLLLFGDEFTMSQMQQSAAAEWVRKGIWLKPDAMPQMSGDRPGSGFEEIAIFHAPRESGRMKWNGGGHCAVFRHCSERAERHHETPKPVPLMLELVELFTDPDELILDPFAGSGTTGVACLRLGRRFIGIEREPKYAAVARERLRAEENGLTLRDSRAGQLPMFGASE